MDKEQEEQRRSLNKKIMKYFAIAVLLSISIVIIAAVNSNTSEVVKGGHEIENDIRWFSGGTLHESTVQEWHAAASANKLATAGDIVFVLLGKPKDTPLERVKEISQEMVDCLNEIDTEHGAMVSSTMVICYALMGSPV